MIAYKARAKINLTLEILGTRSDGYHDLVSIMQTIDIADTLSFKPAESLEFRCDDQNLDSSDNLVMKAALLLKKVTGTNRGAKIELSKRIPVASGLGGGSSDAAVTLIALNELWDLGMSLDELLPIALELGSDTPFFLYGGTAMVHGRGDKVRKLPPPQLGHVLVLAPDINIPCKTASLFDRIDQTAFTMGGLTRKLEARIRNGGDVPSQLLFNAFDTVAFETFPNFNVYWEALDKLGIKEMHVSGSGPSIFFPVTCLDTAKAIKLILDYRYKWKSYLVPLWNRESHCI